MTEIGTDDKMSDESGLTPIEFKVRMGIWHLNC